MIIAILGKRIDKRVNSRQHSEFGMQFFAGKFKLEAANLEKPSGGFCQPFSTLPSWTWSEIGDKTTEPQLWEQAQVTFSSSGRTTVDKQGRRKDLRIMELPFNWRSTIGIESIVAGQTLFNACSGGTSRKNVDFLRKFFSVDDAWSSL
jgi:hypothetical protein